MMKVEKPLAPAVLELTCLFNWPWHQLPLLCRIMRARNLLLHDDQYCPDSAVSRPGAAFMVQQLEGTQVLMVRAFAKINKVWHHRTWLDAFIRSCVLWDDVVAQ